MSKVKLKRNKLILAFPGMGKTPLSKLDGNYRDLDFGTFRSGMHVSKSKERNLLPIFRDYLVAMDKDVSGMIFMTNEPKIMDYMYVDHMYLPNYLRGKYVQYSASKLGVDAATTCLWIKDWARMAQRRNIPITYLNIGLDQYLDPRTRKQIFHNTVGRIHLLKVNLPKIKL